MGFNYNVSDASDKKEKYQNCLQQIDAIIKNEVNLVANLANICAVLRAEFGWFWIGFYWVDNSEELVLGPFQGSLACTRISKGKGVCGTAWQQKQTIVVPDVNLFEGHIACSAQSQSEIVVPVIKAGQVVGVLDIDSDSLNAFDNIDAMYLEQLAEILVARIPHT